MKLGERRMSVLGDAAHLCRVPGAGISSRLLALLFACSHCKRMSLPAEDASSGIWKTELPILGSQLYLLAEIGYLEASDT